MKPKSTRWMLLIAAGLAATWQVQHQAVKRTSPAEAPAERARESAVARAPETPAPKAPQTDSLDSVQAPVNATARDNQTPQVANMAKLESFAGWVEEWKKTDPEARAAMTARGVELSQERREAMRTLIESDPEQAIKMAIPYEVRDQLPGRIVERLETPINSLGNYYVAALTPEPGAALNEPSIQRTAEVGGVTYRVHAYGQGLQRATRENVPVHGVALDDQLALNANPYRRMTRSEVDYRQSKGQINPVCPTSGEPAGQGEIPPAADIGGKLLVTCQESHLVAALDRANAAVGGGSSGNGQVAESPAVGSRTFLYMRVRFSDQGDANYEPQTLAGAQQQAADVNKFLTSASFGAHSLAITIPPTITLPNTEAWYYDNGSWTKMLEHARTAAAAAGYNPANYDDDGIRYNNGPGAFGGVAWVGGKGLAVKYDSQGLFCHEYGHNMGLWHANYWATDDGTAIGSGRTQEYGDSFDVLGSSGTMMKGHYNANFKSLLGWMPSANVHAAASAAGSKNSYRVYAHDLGGTLNGLHYAIKIAKDTDREYWVSYRQHPDWGSNGVTKGAQLHWDRWASSINGTTLIDTTPGSSDGKNDCTIVPGRTFSDTAADIHFTVVQKVDAAGGNPPALDVVVAKGPFAGNQAPTVNLVANPANPAVGQQVTLTANANDPNGDTMAYQWDTGDGVLRPNATSITTTWPVGGMKVVKCTVSDMKGLVDSETLNVPVGSVPPAPWVAADIGTPMAGGEQYNSGTGAFTVQGSGSDIWDGADNFHYLYQTLIGDGEISARVTSQTNTDYWAKAGVMIRDGVGAGAINSFAAITPGYGYRFQHRPTTGAGSVSAAGPGLNPAPNNWIRLTRSGNLVTAYSSSNGTTWTQYATVNLTMPNSVLVGLAVTSHNASARSTATFDNVKVISSSFASGVWTNAAGGSWPTAANWSNSTVAAGAGKTADFSTLNLTADATVTLDGARTLGNLSFGDTTASNNWTLNAGGGGALTLDVASGSPAITVNNQTATINLALAGTKGLTKAGAGTLALTGANTYSGITTVSAGVLSVSGNQSAANGGLAVNANATMNLLSGSTVAVASGKAVNLANTVTGHSLNVAGTVTNAGSLTMGGASTLAINSGGAWIQSGAMSLSPIWSYETARIQVNTGGTFTYTGTSTIPLKSSNSVAGLTDRSIVTMAGGSFATGYGFNNPIVGGAGSASLEFSSGGTLKLTGNIATLATTADRPFYVSIGTGGGIIDTNGFSTTITQGITNLSGQTGSLTKRGAGTLTLSGASTFTGSTTVESGTLAGTGSLTSATTVQGGATLAPGAGGIGTFSVKKTLSLSGTTAMEISKSGSSLTADKVSGMSTVTYGGTLSVTKVGADALVAGNAFQLFSATSYQGSFTTLNLPTLGTGLAWDTSRLIVDGTIAVKSTAAAAAGLPAGWAKADIGSPTIAGTSSESGGIYTLAGSGTGFANGSDQFHFAWQSLSGDGEIKLRLASVSGGSATTALAGVMIRESTANGSRFAYCGRRADGTMQFTRRSSTGGNISTTTSGTNSAPVWVRLVRSGNSITASKSTNGTSWTTIGSNNVNMASQISIGIAVSSGNNTSSSTAIFDNVTIVP